MQESWRWSNLLLAFGMELAALAVFALWGWRAGDSTAIRMLLAVVLPAAAIIVWALFAAPDASYRGPVVTTLVKIAFFGLAGLALWSLDHRILGVALVLVVAANLLIIRVGDLSPDTPPRSATQVSTT